jgi:hypothetical protein
VTPRRVENSLLVVEPFTDRAGSKWQPGDHAPLARRAVREAAESNPSWFRVEFETLPFDPAEPWFRNIAADHEQRYEALRRNRGTAKEREQAALRAELAAQEKGDPRDLERRYEQQEREREERKKRAGEQQERRRLENELELQGGGFVRSGFHYDD